MAAHHFVLLVEGEEDKRVIPELVEANGHRWGERDEPKLVHIVQHGGYENLVAPGEIATRLKQSGLQALGIIVDADTDPSSSWADIKRELASATDTLPEAVPAEGLVVTTVLGVRVGVWIMPDNTRPGMLETFLQDIIRDPTGQLAEFAQSATSRARAEYGAPCKGAHHDKAVIHTWLAWQDPPGRPLHNAVMERILDPKAPSSAPFLAWFRRLFALAVPE